jgi:hypothetical protein
VKLEALRPSGALEAIVELVECRGYDSSWHKSHDVQTSHRKQ